MATYFVWNVNSVADVTCQPSKKRARNIYERQAQSIFPCVSPTPPPLHRMGLSLACMLNTNNDEKSLFGQFALGGLFGCLMFGFNVNVFIGDCDIWRWCVVCQWMESKIPLYTHSLSFYRNHILLSIYWRNENKYIRARFEFFANGPIHWLKQSIIVITVHENQLLKSRRVYWYTVCCTQIHTVSCFFMGCSWRLGPD